MREDSARFARGEDDRKLRWPGNTLDVVNEVEFSFEHLLVKKQQCAESLVLSGGGDALFNGEMSEKFGDFFLAHFLGVTFAMKQDVTTDPIDICLLGTDRIMFYPQVPADAVEQFWRGCDCSSRTGHVPDRAKINAAWQADD